MFADIVGFTSLCQKVTPAAVMKLLNELYTKLDDLVGKHNVYKVIRTSALTVAIIRWNQLMQQGSYPAFEYPAFYVL